jgi:hypothetical protein
MPPNSSLSIEEKVAAMKATFQRDLNRLSDPDRNTRKRGLQKLLDDLPWGSKSQKKTLQRFIRGHVLCELRTTVTDPVEKCRDLSLWLLRRICETAETLPCQQVALMVKLLTSRINTVPFVEPAEELRLTCVEVLHSLCAHKSFREACVSLGPQPECQYEAQVLAPCVEAGAGPEQEQEQEPAPEAVPESHPEPDTEGDSIDVGRYEPDLPAPADVLVASLSKILADAFPAVKKLGAELVLLLLPTDSYCASSRSSSSSSSSSDDSSSSSGSSSSGNNNECIYAIQQAVCRHAKHLLKALSSNCSHQVACFTKQT